MESDRSDSVGDLHEELRRDLARRLDAGQEDAILLALHVSCGAFALGLRGRVEPHRELESDRSDSVA